MTRCRSNFMTKLLDWLDNRTGYRQVVHEALEEPIPGGAKWKYVFGSALTATFAIQVVTGALLMTAYAPSSTTAWGSVYYINDVMTFGWLIRGVHHFGSQAMIVLLALHMLQVLLAGAYRAPREVNWWFGLILAFFTVALGLTGYLLPWDQKGYWATKVATNIMGSVPLVGSSIQQVVVGGSDYGNHTLTRFYALHVVVLPALLALAVVIHVALFRKHGVTHPKDTKGIVEGFWPKQVFYDTVAASLVLFTLVGLTVWEGGANLDAPADPSSSDYPARPEWYFLSLFQMLKYPIFAGENEVLGTVVVPGAIVGLLAVLPLLDRIMPNRLAHFVACGSVFALLGAAIYLTVAAVLEDNRNPDFLASRAKADRERLRALQLASHPEAGVPPDGANYILARDPYTRGQAVFAQKCQSCHYFNGEGQVVELDGQRSMSPQTAADLDGYGTRAWLDGLLADPSSDRYFGKVPQCSGMTTWKQTTKLTADQIKLVADFVATFAAIPEDVTPAEWAESLDDAFMERYPGMEHYINDCGRCHLTGGADGITEGGEQDAPDLFAWGSPRWTSRMIRKPHATDKYGYLYGGDQDTEVPNMPAFPPDQLTNSDLVMIIRYLKGDYIPPPSDRSRNETSSASSTLAETRAAESAATPGE